MNKIKVLWTLHMETIEYLIVPRIGVRWRWPFIWVDLYITQTEALTPEQIKEVRDREHA